MAMATRTLLKLKPNLNLPLRFFRNPSFSLTRPVSPFTRPDSTSLSLLKPSTVSFQGTLARQMATARSPRGASRMDEEEEDDHDDGDFDDDDEDEFDLNDEFDDSDCDEFDDEDEDEEEEKPKGNKTNPKKR